MPEIVVLSGKGGTGKTSLTAAFAHLAQDHVICDLDVDAPDLHLLLAPRRLSSTAFVSGHKARIDPARCDGCGRCAQVCRFGAVTAGSPAVNDPLRCEGCKLCVTLCPAEAIEFPATHCGDWYLSETRLGPLVHAQLFPGEENSGRLVALLRQQARQLAARLGHRLILADGPPGIGCPVISSLSGADLALLVTEPTPTGLHDLERVVELCGHFRVPAGVLINKSDLNPRQADAIAAFCAARGLALLGHLPHDPAVTEAMVQGLAITEYRPDGLAQTLREIWSRVQDRLSASTGPQTNPMTAIHPLN
jgi:MinD superfamily P-loop ATPase